MYRYRHYPQDLTGSNFANHANAKKKRKENGMHMCMVREGFKKKASKAVCNTLSDVTISACSKLVYIFPVINDNISCVVLSSYTPQLARIYIGVYSARAEETLYEYD